MISVATAAAAQLPWVELWPGGWGRVRRPYAIARFSGAVGSAAISGDQNQKNFLHHSPGSTCSMVHPPLPIQIDGILWHPGMLGRSTFDVLLVVG